MAPFPALHQPHREPLLSRHLGVSLYLVAVRRAHHLPPAAGAERAHRFAGRIAVVYGSSVARDYDEEESLRGVPHAVERQQVQPRSISFAHCPAHTHRLGVSAGADGHAAPHKPRVGGGHYDRCHPDHLVFKGY